MSWNVVGRAGALVLALGVVGFVVLQACGSGPGATPDPAPSIPVVAAPASAAAPPEGPAAADPPPAAVEPVASALPPMAPPPSGNAAAGGKNASPPSGPPFMGATKSGMPFHPQAADPQPVKPAPPVQQSAAPNAPGVR